MTCLLTPFKEQHLLELDYQEPLKVSRDTLFSLGRFYSHWPAWSALRDDKVIGSAGMYYVAPGHFAAWAALSTELLCDYPLWLHRQIVKGLNEAVAFLPARLVTAKVLTDQQRYHRWLRQLGFSERGVVGRFTTYAREFV